MGDQILSTNFERILLVIPGYFVPVLLKVYLNRWYKSKAFTVYPPAIITKTGCINDDNKTD